MANSTYDPLDGATGIGLPFDHGVWRPYRKRARQKRKQFRELGWGIPNVELGWGIPNVELGWGIPNVELGFGYPDTEFRYNYTADPESAKESANKLFEEVENLRKQNELIDEFEKFLTSMNSDVPGRDELRDKIRDLKRDRRTKLMKNMQM